MEDAVEQYLRLSLQACATQVFVDGLFNADPHSGNILVQVGDDGTVRPVLIAFGLTKRLDLQMKQALAQMVYSAYSRDFGGLLESFDAMGLVLKREDPAEDMRVLRFVLRDTQPPREAKATLAKWRTQQMEKRAHLEPCQRNPIDAWPGDLLFFFRVILLLRGLCSALDVRLPYLQVLAPYAQLTLARRYPHDMRAMALLREPRMSSALTVCAPYGFTRAPDPRVTRSALQTAVRETLLRLGSHNKYIGIQVSVYRAGHLVVDECM